MKFVVILATTIALVAPCSLASFAGNKLRISRDLQAQIKEHHSATPTRLRGAPHNASLNPTSKAIHHKPILVALQKTKSTRLQKSDGTAEGQESMTKLAHTMAKHEHVYFSRLLKSLHRQVALKQRSRHVRRVDLCNGDQFAWMMATRSACTDSYGEDSTWDNSRAEGTCATAWDECNSDFVSRCCTQPEGPRNMAAYCSNSAGQNASQDRACAVQRDMGGLQASLGGIRDSVSLISSRPPAAPSDTIFTIVSGDCKTEDEGRCVVSPNWPDEYANDDECEIVAPSRGVNYPKARFVTKQFDTESCCDKIEVAGEIFTGDSRDDGPDEDVTEATKMTWQSDFSGAARGWKVCVEDIIPPPAPPAPPAPVPTLPCYEMSAWGPYPGPGPSPGPALNVVPCPGPSPGPAMVPSGLAGKEGAGRRRDHRRRRRGTIPGKVGPRKMTKLETQCMKLTDLVRKAAKQIDAVRAFAQHDGIAPAVEQPKPKSGKTALLGMFGLVTRAGSTPRTSEASDPDLTFAVQRVVEVGVKLDGLRDCELCRKGSAAVDDDDDDDDEDDDDEDDSAAAAAGLVSINISAITALLEFDSEMEVAVAKFESDVHPHGEKWWRYRYEYTLVESLVLAFSVMLLWLVMSLFNGVSFFGKFKFYNIGLTSRLYRYAWGYMLFHAASLMVMVTIAYMLYMPWGENNIINVSAKAFHELVDGRANVPFLGYSWLLMILDVQFQLFVCFIFYVLFIAFVARNFGRALDDWKAMSEDPSGRGRLAINDHHYKEFTQIMIHRVQKFEGFQRAFTELRLHLPGVTGVTRHKDCNDFMLHLYFTDCFGKALENLVEVSLKTNVVLAMSALLVAFLAHHYQVAFMYFLPGFIVAGFLLFVGAFVISRDLHNHNHSQPLGFITVHNYCRSIQIVLYCVFFSFSRLLLSKDIFTDYPRVYLAACFGIVILLLLCCSVLNEVMKSTIVAIVLPHESEEQRFKDHCQNVSYWHSTETCKECGVRQAPPGGSHSRAWCGGGTSASGEGSDRKTDRGWTQSFR